MTAGGSWLRAAARRSHTNPWLGVLAVAAVVAALLGWNAHTGTAVRMWFGVAAGLGGLWAAAGAVCWQLRQPDEPLPQHSSERGNP